MKNMFRRQIQQRIFQNNMEVTVKNSALGTKVYYVNDKSWSRKKGQFTSYIGISLMTYQVMSKEDIELQIFVIFINIMFIHRKVAKFDRL